MINFISSLYLFNFIQLYLVREDIQPPKTLSNIPMDEQLPDCDY